MLKKTRLVLQIAFVILFTVSFFTLTRVPEAYHVPSHWFLRLNPLVSLLASAASRGIFPPLILSGITVTLLTIVFGRFFCGMLCPLGAVIDFFDRFLFKRMRIRNCRPPLWAQKIKYVMLIGLISMAVLGSMTPLFMDPVLMMTRFFTLVINPLASVAAEDSKATLTPVFNAIGLDNLSYSVIHIPLYYGGAGAATLMILIIGAGIFDRRFWCQYICPSGALLGLLSRFAIFRRRVCADTCTSCRACFVGCPTRAIAEDGRKTSTAECIVCGLCTARKKSCNSFGFAPFFRLQTCGADLERRHAFAGILGGLLLVPAIRANASLRRSDAGRCIRPPGAIPETEFLGRCISCGACMKVCPTNAIQPCTLGDGFQRVYTPKIVPRIGGCEEKCHACGYVCPTGALRKLSYEEKRFAKIGTAVIDRHRCLAWEQNKECLVCDEVCPYNAITAMIVQTTTGRFKVPVVNEDLCLGCGMCEQHCPITDQAAIIVYRFGENRRSTGPYIREKDKAEILKKRQESDSDIGVSLEGSVRGTYEEPVSRPSTAGNHGSEKETGDTPPGFAF